MKRNTRNCEIWFQREVRDILEGQRGKVHVNKYSINTRMRRATVVVYATKKNKTENRNEKMINTKRRRRKI